MGHIPRTIRGYDFYECASAMQKAIRRADAKTAGYFALELAESGFANFVWKRLLTITAEDCWGVITQEIEALRQAFLAVNERRPKSGKTPGRVFIGKAVILLSLAQKSRDADHLACFVYDEKVGISDAEIEQVLQETRAENMPVADYALDVHTLAGRKRGKTKADFFREEHAALHPRQVGLFDHFLERGPHGDAIQAQDGTPSRGATLTPCAGGRGAHHQDGEDDECERGHR